MLRWVRDESVYEVWQRLTELGLGDAGADEITDVVSCPGTDSLQARHHQLDGPQPAPSRSGSRRWTSTDPLTKRIHIKMSGCPNGCSQHHIANIGFYGASIKVGDKHHPRLHPAHRRPLRGRRGHLRHAAEVAPALQARARRRGALAALLRGDEREDGEEFNDFAERVGPASFTELVKDLSMPVEFNVENMDFFIDWKRSDLYQVIRGEGECAV